MFPQADMIDSEDMDELIVPPDGHPKVSAVTAIEYQQLWRDMVAEHMAKETSGYMVGGPGTTIEIDESMFGGFHHFLSPIQLIFFWFSTVLMTLFSGKRKYHRGRITNRRHVWVLGGVVR